MNVKRTDVEALAAVVASLSALALAYIYHSWGPLFGVPVVLLAYWWRGKKYAGTTCTTSTR